LTPNKKASESKPFITPYTITPYVHTDNIVSYTYISYNSIKKTYI